MITPPLQPLIVDIAKIDAITPQQINTLVAAGYPWAGLAMQCSNGLSMAGAWFNTSWLHAGRIGVGTRYGVDWFRFPYHYLRIEESPTKQADLALLAVDTAGGWDDGDLWMAVDIERAQQPGMVTASQVEAAVSTFAARILARTGRRPVLYAGSYTRDLGITSHMGCSLLWYPQWAPSISWPTVVRMGWDMDTTLLWQVTGNAPATVPGYPQTTPIGLQDYSIMVRANLPAQEALAWTRTHTGARPVPVI
jgi:hypothetical protein